jgi:hypothetical protein
LIHIELALQKQKANENMLQKAARFYRLVLAAARVASAAAVL